MSTRTQILPIVAPDLGLVADVPAHAVPERAWTFVLNGRFRRGRAEKVPGYSAVQTQALDGPVMGLYDYRTTGGFQAWIAVTTRRVYKKTPSDPTFVDITGATLLTGFPNEFVDFTTFKDLLIFTNGRDPIKKWDGQAATVSNLGGNPPKAKRITTFQNHVVLGYIDPTSVIPSPQKIQWSDLGLAEVWAGGEAGSMSFVDEPSGVVEVMPLRDSLIVYKEDAIYLVDYTGFPFTMSSRRMATGVGPISSRIVANVRDAHYFIGSDGQIYRLTLSGPEPIMESVRSQLFDELNYRRRDRAFAFVSESTGELYFCIPTGADDFPSVAYVYNYNEGKVGRRELRATAASPNGVLQLSDITWDTAVGTWDSQTDTWDSTRQAAGVPIILHGDSGGKVYKHQTGDANADGLPIRFMVETKMFDFGAPARKKRLLRLHLHYDMAAGTTLSVYVLTAPGPGVTPAVHGPYSIVLDGSGDQWVDINLTAVYFGFRFVNEESGRPCAITGYVPEFYVREEN